MHEAHSLAGASYPLLFSAGLLGGFSHCLGMCGPVAAAIGLARSGPRAFVPHVLYNLGRVTTYGLLGGAAGAAGSYAAVAPPHSLQKGILAGTGLLVIVTGLAVGGWLPGDLRGLGDDAQDGLAARLVRSFRGRSGPGACYPLGLVLGFLPCGLLYGALLASAREGMEAGSLPEAFLRGAAAMVLFGAGTVPALLLFGRAVAFLGARLRETLVKASAAALVLAGALSVIRALAR